MSSIKDIEKLIQIYLYQRKSVSLPGIGTFKIVRVKPKEFDSGKYLWGPIHIIQLDTKLESNGKEIFDYVSIKMNITEWESIKLVNEFVTNLKTVVRRDSKYQMEGLGSIELKGDGSFFLNSGTLQYPFYTRIQKPDADLIQTYEEPISEQVETIEEYGESLEYPEDNTPKDRWWISVLVILILSILFMAISLTRSDIPFGGRQSRSDLQAAPMQYE